MNKHSRRGYAEPVAFVFVMACVICFMVLVACVAYDAGYENGQTEALSGKAIWYEKAENRRGEKVWKELGKPTTRPAATP